MAMNLDNVKIIEVNNTEEHTEQPSYYSVIPANVRYDSDLSPYAILLYGEITALTHKSGYCYASNTYFAKRYERTPQAVSKWINQLAEKGYINIVYCRCKNIIVERRIYITSEVSTTVDRVSTPVDEGINQELIGYQQRIKENNKYNNKTNIKNSSEVDTSDFPEDPTSDFPEDITSANTDSVIKTRNYPYSQFYSLHSRLYKHLVEKGKILDKPLVYNYKAIGSRFKNLLANPFFTEEKILRGIQNAVNDEPCLENNFALLPMLSEANLTRLIEERYITSKKSNYQKKRDGAIERSNMITDDDEYKLF